MSFSRRTFINTFGRAELPAGAETLLCHEEFAGDPTGAVVPAHIGQELFDTAGRRFYRAVGITTADWRAVTA